MSGSKAAVDGHQSAEDTIAASLTADCAPRSLARVKISTSADEFVAFLSQETRAIQGASTADESAVGHDKKQDTDLVQCGPQQCLLRNAPRRPNHFSHNVDSVKHPDGPSLCPDYPLRRFCKRRAPWWIYNR